MFPRCCTIQWLRLLTLSLRLYLYLCERIRWPPFQWYAPLWRAFDYECVSPTLQVDWHTQLALNLAKVAELKRVMPIFMSMPSDRLVLSWSQIRVHITQWAMCTCQNTPLATTRRPVEPRLLHTFLLLGMEEEEHVSIIHFVENSMEKKKQYRWARHKCLQVCVWWWQCHSSVLGCCSRLRWQRNWVNIVMSDSCMLSTTRVIIWDTCASFCELISAMLVDECPSVLLQAVAKDRTSKSKCCTKAAPPDDKLTITGPEERPSSTSLSKIKNGTRTKLLTAILTTQGERDKVGHTLLYRLRVLKQKIFTGSLDELLSEMIQQVLPDVRGINWLYFHQAAAINATWKSAMLLYRIALLHWCSLTYVAQVILQFWRVCNVIASKCISLENQTSLKEYVGTRLRHYICILQCDNRKTSTKHVTSLWHRGTCSVTTPS